jgi:hypothetical protein
MLDSLSYELPHYRKQNPSTLYNKVNLYHARIWAYGYDQGEVSLSLSLNFEHITIFNQLQLLSSLSSWSSFCFFVFLHSVTS